MAEPPVYHEVLHRYRDKTLGISWLLLLILLGFAATLGVDVSAQFWFAYTMIALLTLLRTRCGHGLARFVYLGVIVFLSIRYLGWRTFSTLNFGAYWDSAAMLLLYTAEVYAVVLGLLGIFVCIEPISRAVIPVAQQPDAFPRVDVFITTYNETPSLLNVTLRAATQMRYPRDRYTVFLLDDGGTDARCDPRNGTTAEPARARRQELEQLCRRLGVTYLTRRDNEHHKAGNINAALPRSDGELIVILDADHVPAADFLDKTVGYFAHDPKLFLVQTPHYFINPDPVEKNLETFEKTPSENEMFYRLMQRGLDYWNGSLFAGSAAVLRRRHLDEIGGFAISTVTEDAETALELHSRGYNSAYMPHPVVSGLAPEDFSSFITQRKRWATGMVQILLLKNPLLRSGLTLSQRICYLSSCLYWLFPFARVVFLLAPIMYLMFGLHIYDASVAEILAYTVPHYWASFSLSSFMYGKVRWPFVSLLYEMLQSLFTLPALVKVFRAPRAPKFTVTPKGQHLEEDFISPLAPRFYLVVGLLLLTYAVGAYRYQGSITERDLVLLVGFWHTMNFLILLAALGVLAELRQRREVPRVKLAQTARLRGDGLDVECRLVDLSTGGCAINVDGREHAQYLQEGKPLKLAVQVEALDRDCELEAEIRSLQLQGNTAKLGLTFRPRSADEYSNIVAFVHGDSMRWLRAWQRPRRNVGSVRGLIALVYWGVLHSGPHLRYLAQLALRTMGSRRTTGHDKTRAVVLQERA